ncbi:TPA: hypothetical protein ROY17_005826 [Bacillus thuringiensis]|nr:hypothetical protein [Bacillus thuringiensis]
MQKNAVPVLVSSPSIVINLGGSIAITLSLMAGFSITLNDDLSIGASLTSLSFRKS